MTQAQPYGPNNPHPLSRMKTELVWEGKYDDYGNRRTVDTAGLALPLQRIETIDEPRSRAAASGASQLALFEREMAGKRDDFRNRLIWGDNKLVMASLLSEFRGAVDLIYIDPPFDVGADFTMNVPIGDEKETTQKEQSLLEMVAYRDIWGKGTDSYLHMMYERLSLMKELLSESGSIYVHCDWRVNSITRLVLDEIFGSENFVNEIIWRYGKMSNATRSYPKNHDVIFWYAKSQNYKFLPVKESDSEYKARFSRLVKDNKVFYGSVRNSSDKLILGRIKKVSQAIGRELIDEDILFDFDLEFKTQDDVFYDLSIVKGNADEKADYPTQKPEALISRIINSSSTEGDLVADFFCGSGTTGAVAERLGRRWLMSDLGRFAIHTSRKRLIELQRAQHEANQPYRSFDVYNLGRYERQWWQRERLHGADTEHRKLVLEFYRAEPLQAAKVEPTSEVGSTSPAASSPLLHARKGAALIHVDGIDGLFTRADLAHVAYAAREAGARELHCLAWEFEMDLKLESDRLEHETGLRIRLVRIPREIMEKNRTVADPHIFLEVATLGAQPIVRSRPKADGGGSMVDIKLTQFIPSLTEVPAKELAALQERAQESGFDFIDFWAVDFDYHDGQPFNHHWQTYRTRKDRGLPTVSTQAYVYPRPGKYTACVKVVDVFGADTSITVDIEVK